MRNGIGTVSTVAGQTDYGDFGLFSSGSCNEDGSVCEPPLNTPFAPYHALALLDRFANAGDQLLRVTTNDPLVRGHAVRRPNGELAVLLLNEDPDRERTVAIDYAGYTPSPNAPKVSTYLNGAAGIVESRTGTAASQTLPAYSLTTFTLKPKLSRTLPVTAGTPVGVRGHRQHGDRDLEGAAAQRPHRRLRRLPAGRRRRPAGRPRQRHLHRADRAGAGQPVHGDRGDQGQGRCGELVHARGRVRHREPRRRAGAASG